MAKQSEHGRTLRPIIRDYWSEDVATAALFAFNNGAKLSAGAAQYRQRFTTGSAGVPLSGTQIGGGTFEPAVGPNGPRQTQIGST